MVTVPPLEPARSERQGKTAGRLLSRSAQSVGGSADSLVAKNIVTKATTRVILRAPSPIAEAVQPRWSPSPRPITLDARGPTKPGNRLEFGGSRNVKSD